MPITLGGKPYTLGFTIGAMRRAQELGVLQVDVSDGTAFMLAMPGYVWACLPEEAREELSVKAIDELINPNNIKPISDAVGELFRLSMPKEESPGNGLPAAAMEKRPTAGSTSTSSGQLASTT